MSCRQYLNDHGITSYEIVRKYRLGLHEGRLAIPYLTPSGVRSITLRCLEDHGSGPGVNCGSVPGHPKYLPIREGQKKRLYNVAAFREADALIGMVEGEIDAIVATEILAIPTIGIPSATAWKKFWAHNFEDYQHVVLWRDGDTAGKTMKATVEAGIKDALIAVACPPGEDVSSMVVAGRGDELLEAAGAAGGPGVSAFVNSHRLVS